MTTLLVVSPHLDDAVLSCGGAIHAAARRGDRVVVLTVFTEGEGCADRRAEDRAAVTSLGGEVIHLGHLDAPERRGLPRTHRALVETADVIPSEIALVRSAIGDAVLEQRPSSLLAPLGVGWHIDHRLIFEALRDWPRDSRGTPTVTFYEERPYAFLPGAVRAQAIASGYEVPRGLELPPDDVATREAIATLPHLRAYVRDARSRDWLAAQLSVPAPAACDSGLVARVTSYDEETAVAVARAVALYTSQIADLFGEERAITTSLRGAACALGGAPHAERTFSTHAVRRGTRSP